MFSKGQSYKEGEQICIFQGTLIGWEGREGLLFCCLVTPLCPTLLWPHGLQPARLLPWKSMGFPRQEYWSGLPFPSPGDLPDPGIKPESPAWAGRFIGTKPPGKYTRSWWHPTPVLLPGKSQGRRSLVGYSPWGHKESDMTERLHFQATWEVHQILNKWVQLSFWAWKSEDLSLNSCIHPNRCLEKYLPPRVPTWDHPLAPSISGQHLSAIVGKNVPSVKNLFFLNPEQEF